MRNIFEYLYYDSNHGMNIPEQDAKAIVKLITSRGGHKIAKITLGDNSSRNYFYERTVAACKEDFLAISDLLIKNGWQCIEICCTDPAEESEIVWQK